MRQHNIDMAPLHATATVALTLQLALVTSGTTATWVSVSNCAEARGGSRSSSGTHYAPTRGIAIGGAVTMWGPGFYRALSSGYFPEPAEYR